MSCVDCGRVASSAVGSVDSGRCLKHVRTSEVLPRQNVLRGSSGVVRGYSVASECKHIVQGRAVNHRRCYNVLRGLCSSGVFIGQRG